jgi:hypothetical protein
MKKLNLFFMLLAGIMIFSACDKEEEEEYGNPTISFGVAEEFVSADTEKAAGEAYTIQLIANWNGNDKITNYVVSVNDEPIKNEGVNVEELAETIDLIKSQEDTDIVKIYVKDAAGNEVETSITITKAGEAFGNILTFTVTLGAQDNTEFGGALNIVEGAAKTFEEGATAPESIDIIYYYDAASGDNNTLGSANANFDGLLSTYAGDPEQWSVRNESRYSKSDIEIDAAAFDAMENDELIIANLAGDDAKRKAKKLSAGKYYAFYTAAGKNGILRVDEVTGEAEGTITITVKVQE